jgi:hypothetical protein
MELVNPFFKDLVFTKVEPKEGFTIYAAAVSATLGDGKKQYVLVLVPTHMAIVDQAHIHELHWHNVQTRYLQNGYRLAPQRFAVPKGIPLLMFHITRREVSRSTYVAEDNVPLQMDLLHDPKKKSVHQYYDKMNIVGALMTFRCSISVANPIAVSLSNLPSSVPLMMPMAREGVVRPPMPERPQPKQTFARAPISSMMKMPPRPGNVPIMVQQQQTGRGDSDSFEFV